MIKKNYAKSGKSCRVTFKLPAEQVDGNEVCLLGDFNEWDPEVHPLKKRKNGTFSATVSLDAGSAYRFRYLVDGKEWINDEEADEFAPNRFGSRDAIIEV